MLIFGGGLAALLTYPSIASVIAGVAALGFGVPVLVSCAYSVWGTCSITVDDNMCTVIHSLWRWRWTWRFARSRIRSVFLYKPPPAFIMWPGSSGLHVRVDLRDAPRSVPVAAGMHAPRETLDAIQAMLAPSP